MYHCYCLYIVGDGHIFTSGEPFDFILPSGMLSYEIKLNYKIKLLNLLLQKDYVSSSPYQTDYLKTKTNRSKIII